MDKQTITDLALLAQRRLILSLMLDNYVGGGKKIAKWDDTSFSLASFRTWSVNHESTLGTIRRNLDKLAATGVIERRKEYVGAAIRYRFPREICDQFAAEAIAHYRAMGYSQDEIRPEVKP